MRKLLTTFVLSFFIIGISRGQVSPPAKVGPTPNERQMKYLQEPLAAFIHYGINTYTGTDGEEWGDKWKEPATSFNPTKPKVNTDQWVRLFKEAGFKRIILVLKHHDGFCTWPTKQTDYNIANSPYQGGKGDLAKELSESCDKYGMDMGVYLSPWDAHDPAYGDKSPGDYNEMYDAQLRELLGGNYGRLNPETGKREIVEIWMDGATGTADPQTYALNRFYATVRELQPNCLVWMDAKWHFDQKGVRTNYNLDAMWVGNESGYISDPAWNRIDLTKLGNGQQGRAANGDIYCVSEADVSIRPGWFYHTAQNGSVKTYKQIFDNLYARSVGMGIPLLLNIPPNRAGEFHANDSAALVKFGEVLKNTFKQNLITPTMTVTASASRGEGYEAAKAIDGNYDTYWTLADGQKTGSITIDLGKDVDMDIVKIQEYIPLGQRISGFKVELEVYGNWVELGSGQTIGYERMVKGVLMKARKIRVSVTGSLDVPLICNISAYRSDPAITTTGAVPSGINSITGTNFDTPKPMKISKLKFEIKEIAAGRWPTLAEMRFFTRDAQGKLQEIDRAGFTATATSEAKKVVNGEPDALASNTIDGDNTTIWQPEWMPKVSMPQSLMYDFGKQIECSEISYLPRASMGDIAKVFNIYTAENPTDAYTLSLANGAFSTAITQAQYTRIKGGDWTAVANYSVYGAAIRSVVDNAKLEVNNTGGWIRVIATKSPASGIMEVWTNGEKTTTIDLYAAATTKNQVVYEVQNMPADTRVELRATGTKNTAATGSAVTIETVLALQPGVEAMFETAKTADNIDEGIGSYSFEVKRFGDASKPISITVVTSPGTGVHGKTYIDKTQVLNFAAGETVKTGTVEIVNNANVDGNKDFYIELSNPADNTIIGIKNRLKVIVTDNDKPGDSNVNLEGYCAPGGTQHSDMKTYLQTAATTGAKVNLSYSAAASPAAVYVKYLDNGIEAERNSTFTLNLTGFRAGEASSSVVYQDFRYCRAYIYADWNGDLAFTDDEKIATIGELPPADPKLGNFNTVMEIAQPITVPVSAPQQHIALRVLYSNAWSNLPTACSNVSEGMAYDFKLKVLPEGGAGVSKNRQNEFSVFFNKLTSEIRCVGTFSAGARFDVIDVQGKVVATSRQAKAQTQVAIPFHQQKGIYFVSIKNQDKTETHKIIK